MPEASARSGSRIAARVLHGRQERLEEHVAARRADVVGEHEQHADQVRDQGRERRLLDAEVVEDRRRLGARRSRARSRRSSSASRPQRARHLGDVDAAERGAQRVEARRCARATNVVVDQALAHDHRRHARAAGRRRCRAARAGGGASPRVVSVSRGSTTTSGALRSSAKRLKRVGGVVAAVGDLAGWCRARAGSARAPCRRGGRPPARRRTSTGRGGCAASSPARRR